jgi:hypothetical protein
MLRFAQHDKRGVIPNALFCHSERMRGIQYGCFAPFSMTSALSFRTLFFVIPSESEESRAWMLRFAQHHRVVMSSTFVVFTQF